MRGDRGWRKGETGGGSGRAGWLNGEKLAKVSGLGGLEGVVGYNTLQSSQSSYLRQLLTLQPPRSTRSSSTLTLLRPSVTSSLKFSNRSIAVAVPPLWNKLPPALRQISDPSYELTRTSALAISPQLFHSKLKTLLFSKSYPDSSSSTCLPPRLNSKHHPP